MSAISAAMSSDLYQCIEWIASPKVNEFRRGLLEGDQAASAAAKARGSSAATMTRSMVLLRPKSVRTINGSRSRKSIAGAPAIRVALMRPAARGCEDSDQPQRRVNMQEVADQSPVPRLGGERKIEREHLGKDED